jgi:hypothetical protein
MEYKKLSKLERQVITLFCDDYSVPDISKILGNYNNLNRSYNIFTIYAVLKRIKLKLNYKNCELYNLRKICKALKLNNYEFNELKN